MENIKEIFKDKNFNEQTLSLIENFIDEFDSLFGKYVPREELIERIRENLDVDIEFTSFENKNTLGKYKSKEKKILLLEGLPEDKQKAVFFHEMIHCITNHEKYIGFSGELGLERRTAIGLTEGFTQYVSKIRNQKYGIDLNSYPILTEQTENLAQLLGIDKFLDTAFNNPEGLFQLMEDENLVESFIEADEFCDQFDIIWKHENEIYEGKVLSETAEGRLFQDIFRSRDSKTGKLDAAKAMIISTLLGKLKQKTATTKQDFEEIYNLIQKYSKQLNLQDDYNSYVVFLDKVAELEELGKPREEILELIPDEAKEMVEADFKFRDFLKLEPREMLKQLIDPEKNIYENFIYGNFETYYAARVAQSIFKGITNDEIARILTSDLVEGLGEQILQNGWNLDTLAIEVIELDYAPGLTINMYEANGDDIQYLATYSSANDVGQTEKMRVCQGEEKLRLLDENPELNANGVILIGKSGAILEYNGNNEYTYINEYKEVSENYGDVTYYSSYAEELRDRLKATAKRFVSFSKYSVVDVLKSTGDSIKKLEEEYAQVTGKRKFSPMDIERATKDVTIKDVEKILDEITGPQHTKEESLEKGIGYNEQ